MTSSFARMTTAIIAPAANRSPDCSSMPHAVGISTWPRVTSSATAGATWKPANAPAASPCSLITAIANAAPMLRISKCDRWPKPRIGLSKSPAGSGAAMPDANSLQNLARGIAPARSTAFNVKIFADGADLESILELSQNPLIAGFTTNPTLMRKAGIKDYEKFGRELAHTIPDRPFSFEVLSDEFEEMEQQALRIASWGRNVYVKIPITNTRRESCAPLVDRLSRQGVKV